MLQCVVVCCSVLLCVVAFCSVLQCVRVLPVASHDGSGQCVAGGTVCRSVLQRVAACCSVYQACCSVLQRVAACCRVV